MSFSESKVPYAWESRPSGVSWVDKLNAAQAITQCIEWSLVPADTLEANRSVLKNHIKTSQSLEKLGGKSNASSRATSPSQQDKVPPEHIEETSNMDKEQRLTNQGETPHPHQPSNNGANLSSASGGPAVTAQVGDWLAIVQATAAAVGENIAAALSARQQNRDTTVHPRIPRAVYNMVAALPSSSGADSQIFLNFLVGTNQLFELGLADEKQILIAILPKTTGQLRTLWASAITNGQPYSSLYGNILDTFLPERVKQQLISEAVYRVQKVNEPFIEFITNIQDRARILLPSGADLLDVILTGMNGPTRARLAGFPAPRTVEDLLRLVPRLEVIRGIENPPVRSHNNNNQSGYPRQQWSDHRGHNSNSSFSRHNQDGSRGYSNNNNGTGRVQAPYRPNTFQYGANRPQRQGNYSGGNQYQGQPQPQNNSQSAPNATRNFDRNDNRNNQSTSQHKSNSGRGRL